MSSVRVSNSTPQAIVTGCWEFLFLPRMKSRAFPTVLHLSSSCLSYSALKDLSFPAMTHFSNVPLGSHLPLTVAEDKTTQFEVTQDKPVLVAVCHRNSHLPEKFNSLGLGDSPAAAHQAMQVPVGLHEEGVEELRAQQDVCRTGHMLVGRQPSVGCQHHLGLAGRVHLKTEPGVSTARDLGSQAGLAKGDANH